MTNKPYNFCAMTLDVQEVANSKSGKATIANATLGKSGMPVRIVATNGVRRWLKAGKPVTLLGHLAYEENTDGQGTVILFPSRAEKKPDRPRNFVKLTLRTGQDAYAAYSEKGLFWARARMFMGQGKDEEGNYKPSLWLTAKAFAKGEDETLPGALAALDKGDLVTLSGRLLYETYNEKGYISLVVSKLEPFRFEDEEETLTAELPEAELVGEPD